MTMQCAKVWIKGVSRWFLIHSVGSLCLPFFWSNTVELFRSTVGNLNNCRQCNACALQCRNSQVTHGSSLIEYRAVCRAHNNIVMPAWSGMRARANDTISSSVAVEQTVKVARDKRPPLKYYTITVALMCTYAASRACYSTGQKNKDFSRGEMCEMLHLSWAVSNDSNNLRFK